MKFSILRVNEGLLKKYKDFILELNKYESKRDFLNFLSRRFVEFNKVSDLTYMDSISSVNLVDIENDINALTIKMKEVEEKFNKYKFNLFIFLDKLYAKKWYKCNNEEREKLIYDRLTFVRNLVPDKFKRNRINNCWYKLHNLKAKIKNEREKNNDNI